MSIGVSECRAVDPPLCEQLWRQWRCAHLLMMVTGLYQSMSERAPSRLTDVLVRQLMS